MWQLHPCQPAHLLIPHSVHGQLVINHFSYLQTFDTRGGRIATVAIRFVFVSG